VERLRFLLNENVKIDEVIQARIEDLKKYFGARNVCFMMTSTFDKDVIFKQTSGGEVEDRHYKIMHECSINPTVKLENIFPKVEKLEIGKFYEIEKGEFYTISVVHYQQGDSIQTALIGIGFNNKLDFKSINANIKDIKTILDDITTRIELLFLKSDNYSRMYKLLDVFEELARLKSLRLPYHMNNVASWSLEIARAMDFHELDMVNLYFAALAHDIGLVYTDNQIMNKGDALTDSEYRQIKVHPEKGEQLFQLCVLGIPTLADIPKYIRHHHERWDGKGYPDRLSGEAIPLLSQIIAVADAVDSMLSERLFSTPKTISEVKEELIKCSGVQFSPIIVEVMLKLLEHNSINVDHNFVFNDIMVIHNVAVRIQYNNGNLTNYHGNLMINGNLVRITLNDNENLDIKKIQSMKMAFFDRKKLYEFNITPLEINKNTIIIDEMNQIPGDKLFSLYWDLDMDMKLSNKTIKLKALRVGGEGVAFSLNQKWKDAELKDELLRLIGMPISLVLHFGLKDEDNDVMLNAAITGYYISGEKIIFIVKYVNPPHDVVDRIIRYLFRKQMNNQRTHKHSIVR
jgi:HD-GYP domain-containing protein (c-di-GMP phosphodiesterase class II)